MNSESIVKFFETYWLFLTAAVVIVGIIIAVSIILWKHREFDPETASSKKTWVAKAYRNYAEIVKEDEYYRYGKKITTKEGRYTVNFIKACDKLMDGEYSVFFDGYYLSNGFKQFIYANYKNCTVNKLTKMFLSYSSNQMKNVQYNHYQTFENGITPSDFFALRNNSMGDMVGVYVIYNQTRGMYYVGQAKRMIFRVNQHFTGHGNGDVYADYKYGNQFLIRLISLSDSGYSDLDRLERDMISMYDAYNSGYNRTSGNF